MASSVKPRKKDRPTAPAEPVRPAPAAPFGRREWVICAALLLVTFAIYAQVSHHDFLLYDDSDYVTQNAHVRAGLTWDGVAWAFTNTQAGNWFPLTWLSHMLDCQIFGVDSGAIHAMNVFYHGLAVLLLFLILRRMTGAVWRSAFVAFLFSLHPLHVESVAWVAERKDVLNALFWFLTIWIYLGYVQRPNRRRYAALAAVFALALMTKAMAVTLPFALLLLDFWPLRRIAGEAAASGQDAITPRSAIREKGPLLALSLAAAMLTVAAQRGSHYVMPLSLVPLGARISTALTSAVAYIADMFWPAGLAVFYPYDLHPQIWRAVAAAAAILLATVFAIRARRLHPYLAFGWFWYLVTLLPVAGLVQVGSQARADRYTYLPMIGIWVALAWGVEELAGGRRLWKQAAALAAAAACVACAAVTWRQIGYWQDTITLFQHSLSVTQGDYLGYNTLGLAYRDKGRLDEAIASYRRAVAIYPGFEDAHLNLSQALAEKGQAEESLNELAIAVRIDPNDAEALYNLGVGLANQGRFEDAVQAFRAAIQVKPDLAKAHANLGSALGSLDRLDEAIAEFTAALRLDPSLDGLKDNLDAALDMKQQEAAARGK